VRGPERSSGEGVSSRADAFLAELLPDPGPRLESIWAEFLFLNLVLWGVSLLILLVLARRRNGKP
jgi:hypothetical protein